MAVIPTIIFSLKGRDYYLNQKKESRDYRLLYNLIGGNAYHYFTKIIDKNKSYDGYCCFEILSVVPKKIRSEKGPLS